MSDPEEIKTVPPDETEPQTGGDGGVGPDQAGGPPPSQDNPPAPGGRIPPREDGSGT